jgi:hypothetical protein
LSYARPRGVRPAERQGESLLESYITDALATKFVIVFHLQLRGTSAADLAQSQLACESAWNKDPAFGVIGIQSGPRV